MSLLDKATIITTPTAHSNGTLHSIKGGAVADFDVVRGSAATRVNAEGLIEDISVLSGELVSDGLFDTEGVELIANGSFDSDTNWNGVNANGVTISNGSLNFSETTISHNVTQANVVEIGKNYKVTLTISNYIKGSVLVVLGAGGTTQEISANGTYTLYGVASINTVLYIQSRGASNTTLSIDNVSVKEVAADWNLGTGWSISDGKADALDAPFGSELVEANTLVAGKKYSVSFDISNYVKGSVRATIGNLPSNDVSSNGSYTFIITSANTNGLKFQARAGGSGTSLSINNISLIEVIDATNIPRIDYTTGEAVVLLEPQSTNLITYSEDFSDASYVKDAGVSVGTIDNESPSTTLSATKIDANNNGRIYANVAANTYYASVFIKGGVFSYFKFAGVNVDLVSETIASGTIESFGNGWFRIGTTHTGTRPIQIQAYPDATYTTHTTTGDYYIWGAQAEALSHATSYIPTSGAIATRLADVVSGAGDATTFNSTEGVLYAEMARLSNIGNCQFGLFGNSTSQQLRIEISNSLIRAQLFNGAYQANISSTQVVTNNNKIAFKYKENDFALWVNGVEVATDTSGVTFNPNELIKFNLTAQNNTSIPFFGKVKSVITFNTALTDEELECLTTI